MGPTNYGDDNPNSVGNSINKALDDNGNGCKSIFFAVVFAIIVGILVTWLAGCAGQSPCPSVHDTQAIRQAQADSIRLAIYTRKVQREDAEIIRGIKATQYPYTDTVNNITWYGYQLAD